MPDAQRNLEHIHVRHRARDEKYRSRPGGGGGRIRSVDRATHGRTLLHQADSAFEQDRATRQASELPPSYRDTGTTLTIEAARDNDTSYRLDIDRLQRKEEAESGESPWQLRSVRTATEEHNERAAVWIADRHQGTFRRLFQEYLEQDTAPKDGSTTRPKHENLVANISSLRGATLEDLWQSPGDPPRNERCWWSLWLDLEEPNFEIEILRSWARERGIRVRDHVLVLGGRTIIWVEAYWQQLRVLLHAAVPVAEIRWPSFVDSVEDLSRDEQGEYVQDLADRVVAADATAPSVCLLDTGVMRTHVLLGKSLAEEDLHTALGVSASDVHGHGTQLAGLSLYGPLEDTLLHGRSVELRHRLESVRILPSPRELSNRPEDYGTVTATGTALPEASDLRRRVFCLATSDTNAIVHGEPTLWSAMVDALATGADVARTEDLQLRILSPPTSETARLFVVAAGNVEPQAIHEHWGDYLDVCDTSTIQDPAHAWNALTVGAYTELSQPPTNPDYDGWTVLAPPGQLSPHSRTSTLFEPLWPIKPDICLEGGNVIRDGTGFPETCHPRISLRTTGARSDEALESANATSAAAAQAARLAALAMEHYPEYWPETIRGLLVHAAEWKPAMREKLEQVGGKKERAQLLRRYGWGIPSEGAVLSSSPRAVTMVIQDTIRPFEDDFTMKILRLHGLPWPTEALAELYDKSVALSVTLSYFVEPSAGSRGWRGRYSYGSYGLRFDLRGGSESDADFLERVRGNSPTERGRPSLAERWWIGPKQRDVGSVHKDVWVGSGQELADCNAIAVYPVGGWWKRNRRTDRRARSVRYALLVSLTTEENVDLYTPIVNKLQVPVTTPAT